LELPAAPQHFLNSEKIAMGIDPAFDFVCNRLVIKNENANASDGTSCTAKASLTSYQAHTFFYKESSTATSSELNLSIFKQGI
jgi:hypothetical protein